LYKEKLTTLLYERSRGRDKFGMKARNVDPTDPKGTLQRDDNQTISAALKDIESNELISKEKLQGGVFAEVAEEFPKLLAPYAFFKIVYDAYSKLKDIRSGAKPDTEVASLISNFPVLDKFDIHPAFFILLDDPILNTVQNKFMDEVKTLLENNPNAKVGDLPDINMFFEMYINETYPDIEIKIVNKKKRS